MEKIPEIVSFSSMDNCTTVRYTSVLKEKKHFQNRKEKSTGILVGIILVFVLCHIFRLCIQVYEIVSPTHGLHDHFHQCEELKRLHVPAVVLVAGSVNHLLLVTNSSVNFVIYCCMAKRFRKALIDLFRSWRRSICLHENSSNIFCVKSAREENAASSRYN